MSAKTNIIALTLTLLFSIQSLATPKSIEFVTSPLGQTVLADLDAIDLNLLSVLRCKDNVGWYQYRGARLKLKIENDVRYEQEIWQELKVTFDEKTSDCLIKESSKIAQYSLFLQSSRVRFYKAELIIVPTLGSVHLKTEQGELIGEVLDYW